MHACAGGEGDHVNVCVGGGVEAGTMCMRVCVHVGLGGAQLPPSPVAVTLYTV